ncbi:MAG: hypothetical protein QOE25_694 [Actinomycetota bacterium]|nr:hypothetical protein [Actinomycetota bacterium]
MTDDEEVPLRSVRVLLIGGVIAATMFAAAPAFAVVQAADLTVTAYQQPRIGKGIISASGSHERLRMPSPFHWGGTSFTVSCRNLSAHKARLRVIGADRSHHYSFGYSVGKNKNVTTDVTGDGFVTRRLAPGAAVSLTVWIGGPSGLDARGYVQARPLAGGRTDMVRVRIGNQ